MPRRTKPERASSLVAIEGPLGAGKSALAAGWADRHRARVVALDAWANPFLNGALAGQTAFNGQMYFLLERHRQQVALRQADLFERQVVLEGTFERDRLYAELFLTPDELSLHARIFGLLRSSAVVPDLVVHLVPHAEAVLARLRARARAEEQVLTPDRVKDICRAFASELGGLRETRTLRVELGAVDLEERDDAVGEILEAARRARIELAPGDSMHLRVDRP